MSNYTEILLMNLMQIKSNIEKNNYISIADANTLIAVCASEAIYRDELERELDELPLRIYH